jgi:hypothetical protein
MQRRRQFHLTHFAKKHWQFLTLLIHIDSI